MNQTFKEIVSSVVPFIGSLIGGPLGGEAGQAVAYLVTGDKNANQDTVASALQNPTADQVMALKQLDEQYKEKVLSTRVQEDKLTIDDVANARNRQIELHDKMPAYLIMISLAMFFIIMIIFMLFPLQGTSKEIINILIGSLAIWCGQGMNFYFGTTKNSSMKNMGSEISTLGQKK